MSILLRAIMRGFSEKATSFGVLVSTQRKGLKQENAAGRGSFLLCKVEDFATGQGLKITFQLGE